MGCTSSTPVNAKQHAPIHKAHEKNLTAGTETMAASRHDNEIDDTATAAAAGSGAATANITAKTSTSGGHGNMTKAAAAVTTQKIVVGDLTLRYACKSKRGRDPEDAIKPNQDCYSVHHSNNSSSSSSDATAFFGVYDGHGPQGEACSQFVQKRLPDLVNKHILKAQNDYMVLNIDQVQESLHRAHTQCNDELHSSQINDSYSGTTSISLYIHDKCRITVSNVGDSRAVLGKCTAGSAAGASSLSLPSRAVPLSNDQTPYRSDEAARCEKSGARILSFGQLDPSLHQDDEDSQVEDPPRVWSKKGKYPGTAFTRSIGDAVAESLGVNAEPEMMTLKLSPKDQILIVLASDGVFDVMSNQEVINMCFQHRYDPMQACNAIIENSHKEWLENDDCVDEQSASYDDMTIICLFFNEHDEDESKGAFVSETIAATTPSQGQQKQKQRTKRVRQKTLRHLEEMDNA